MSDVDVAVIGSGPAGATTALLLARAGRRTVMVGRPGSPGERVGESLAPSVTPLLHRLGLYDRFLATRPAPCHGNRSAWGGAGALTERDFLRDPHGAGWHIDRPAFDAMLVQAAVEAGAELVSGRASVSRQWRSPGPHLPASSSLHKSDEMEAEDRSRDHASTLSCSQQGQKLRGRVEGLPGQPGIRRGNVGDLSRPSTSWPLAIRQEISTHFLSARVLVDATGRTASLARALGARLARADQMVALTAFLTPDRAPIEDTTTLIEATRDGWWYSAPLPDGRLVTAFHTDPALPAARTGRTPAGWSALLAAADHTRARVTQRGYALTGRPSVVPAGTALLEPMAGAAWLAVGDAAVQHDPLGSHGIAAALNSAIQATAAIQSYLAGDRTAFMRYAAERQAAFVRFLYLRAAYYRDERRWPEAPFWQGRASIPDLQYLCEHSARVLTTLV